MSFPESLKQDFDVLDGSPTAIILPSYRVREKKPFGREFTLRLLPEAFCGDKGIVDDFHDFFTRFAEISNKTNIPQVYSVTGAVNGPVYVLEEYVSGISLKRFADKRKGSKEFEEEAINIIARVCEALHYAHQKDIFHLSVDPEDILIDENNSGKVKLVGFGAQLFVESNRTDSLPTEVKKYLAPELRNGKSFGLRADVYSLAAAIKEVFPETGNWESLISRSLSKTASDRPSSARTFAQELKDLVVKQKSSPRKQSAANNAGGLQPLLNIRTTPEGAQVSLNGASVGITTAAGLRIPWKQGLSIEITKSGFATETLNFTDSPDNSEITVKLKSAFRLFSNPWGASVLVDGKHVGVTDRDGIMVPWDGSTIGIEKAGYKSESLKFVSPPTENQSSVELQPAISSVAPKRHPLEVVGYAMAAIVLWLMPLFIYSFTVNRSGLERDIGEKDREIARLTQAEKALRIDFDKQVSNFRSQVKTKDAEIEKLSQSEKEVIALRSDLNKKDAEITKLIQLDQEKSRLIAELRSDKSLSRLSPALSAPKGQAGQSTNMQLISNARDGNVNHVRALLTQGADPNFRNDGGYTALILASIYGHSEVVKTLLKGGANKDLSYYGWTALDFAKNHNHPVIVTLLNPRGAPPPSPANPAKDKELFAAAQSGDPNIVSVLLSNGANVNARDANGLTPLIVASYQGSWPMINELLKKGADVNLRSNIGKTALMVATQNGHEPVVKLLIEKGANVNVESDRNETALMLAVNMGYKKIANLLRQNGAKN